MPPGSLVLLLLKGRNQRYATRIGDNWAVVFVDKAPQHILSEATAQKALDQRVLLRVLPEGQTHIWQPCDMYAIATIKRKVDRMWDEEK